VVVVAAAVAAVTATTGSVWPAQHRGWLTRERKGHLNLR
jgi:hypothetical protein